MDVDLHTETYPQQRSLRNMTERSIQVVIKRGGRQHTEYRVVTTGIIKSEKSKDLPGWVTFEKAQETKLLESYLAARSIQYNGQNTPKKLKEVFEQFQKMAKIVHIPPIISAYFKKHKRRVAVDVWSHEGIYAVFIDDVLEGFIPSVIVKKKGAPVFDNWLRTSHGFALNGSLLLKDLRKKSRGHFATVRI